MQIIEIKNNNMSILHLILEENIKYIAEIIGGKNSIAKGGITMPPIKGSIGEC